MALTPAEKQKAYRERQRADGLPDDIQRVWGNGKLNVNGQPAINTALHLIDQWGLERFRASAIHQEAMGSGHAFKPDPLGMKS